MAEWIETHRGVVFPWNCDQFGHMNVRHYASHFDDAGFHVWAVVGIGPASFEDLGVITVVARTTTDFKRELRAGVMFVIESGFTRVGVKSVTYAHRMREAETGALAATQEAVEVFFDTKARRSAPMPADLRQRLLANLVIEGAD